MLVQWQAISVSGSAIESERCEGNAVGHRCIWPSTLAWGVSIFLSWSMGRRSRVSGLLKSLLSVLK